MPGDEFFIGGREAPRTPLQQVFSPRPRTGGQIPGGKTTTTQATKDAGEIAFEMLVPQTKGEVALSIVAPGLRFAKPLSAAAKPAARAINKILRSKKLTKADKFDAVSNDVFVRAIRLGDGRIVDANEVKRLTHESMVFHGDIEKYATAKFGKLSGKVDEGFINPDTGKFEDLANFVDNPEINDLFIAAFRAIDDIIE